MKIDYAASLEENFLTVHALFQKENPHAVPHDEGRAAKRLMELMAISTRPRALRVLIHDNEEMPALYLVDTLWAIDEVTCDLWSMKAGTSRFTKVTDVAVQDLLNHLLRIMLVAGLEYMA